MQGVNNSFVCCFAYWRRKLLARLQRGYLFGDPGSGTERIFELRSSICRKIQANYINIENKRIMNTWWSSSFLPSVLECFPSEIVAFKCFCDFTTSAVSGTGSMVFLLRLFYVLCAAELNSVLHRSVLSSNRS